MQIVLVYACDRNDVYWQCCSNSEKVDFEDIWKNPGMVELKYHKALRRHPSLGSSKWKDNRSKVYNIDNSKTKIAVKAVKSIV